MMIQIIREETIRLMDYVRTNPESTCETVAEDYPEL
jgi:hypothetical protein